MRSQNITTNITAVHSSDLNIQCSSRHTENREKPVQSQTRNVCPNVIMFHTIDPKWFTVIF